MEQMDGAVDGAPEIRRAVTVEDLGQQRLRTLAEVSRVEAMLGQARMRGKNLRRGGLVARNLGQRETLKLRLRHLQNRLRTINLAIKAGRRSGAALLLTGHPTPSDERELIGTMYRLFIDAVPPAEQDTRERAIMRIARDYVVSGRSVFAGGRHA